MPLAPSVSHSVGRFRFTLYVAGDSPRSRLAAANFRRLADERLGADYALTVVDVMLHPERAEAARVLTTPTLVRELPAPPRRVTGDLSDAQMVVYALALPPDDATPVRHGGA